MRLSEAIRLGAMLGPQAFGATFENEKSCALGSALRAISITDRPWTATADVWPFVYTRAQHPVLGDTYLVITIIRELNDLHRWTREAIADWVATVEPPEAADAVREDTALPIVTPRATSSGVVLA